jgi:antitoxin component YwqK of YwqJK toxin-antitoxin module
MTTLKDLPYELINIVLFSTNSPKDYLNLLISSRFVGKNFTAEDRERKKSSFLKEKKILFQDGSIKERYTVLPNGRKQGLWEGVHNNGLFLDKWMDRFKEEGNYENGQKYGVWKLSHDGVVIKEENYVKGGLQEGPYIEYLNGNISFECTIGKSGEPEGVAKKYHSNGKIAKEFFYDVDGNLHGISKSYLEDGTLYVEKVFCHGKMTEKFVY